VPPAPAVSVSQQNAIRQGRSYLDLTGFSREGLIGQLEFEGYSTLDASFAVDAISPDWNTQAARKATSYNELTGLSCQGMVDQLVFDGFSQTEARFGASSIGLC